MQRLSVSRPASRVSWGIPVPADPGHTVYVWFDALFNYLTVRRGLPASQEPPRFLHIIGKDIATFHCLYWPAYLHALALEPPRTVLVHGHWLKDGRKMSKSLGNVISPSQLLARFGPEPLKFYLLAHGPLVADASFDKALLLDLHNDFVVGAFGMPLLHSQHPLPRHGQAARLLRAYPPTAPCTGSSPS